MAKLNPYLTFEGNCRKAMEFYRSCLGGELKIMTVGESPAAAQMPKELHESVMHASIETASLTIMASDMLDMEPLSRGNGSSLMLACESEAELRDLFGKLSVGGKVNAAPKLEFWGDFYADLTDKFGLRWMLTAVKPKA